MCCVPLKLQNNVIFINAIVKYQEKVSIAYIIKASTVCIIVGSCALYALLKPNELYALKIINALLIPEIKYKDTEYRYTQYTYQCNS